MKMKKWKAAISLLAPGLFAAWYAFRPERLIVNRRVNEGFPVAADPLSVTAAESGAFYGIRHSTEGTAIIYRLANGDRLLRLTNFRTSNGPDVHVYLVAAADAPDNATVQRAGSSIWELSKVTSVIRITRCRWVWICQSTRRSRSGASGSA
jgi:hypothetical protein